MTPERRNEIEGSIEQDCFDTSDYCSHCQDLLDCLVEIDRLNYEVCSLQKEIRKS